MSPALAGVLVTILKADQTVVRTQQTDAEGKVCVLLLCFTDRQYRAGPLSETEQYVVRAELANYVLTPSSADGRDFVARKMASLTVNIADASGVTVPVCCFPLV